MPNFTKMAAALTVSATIVAAASVVTLEPAAAQSSTPKFCNNTLVTNSLYSNILSNGATAEVEYHGQFQNMAGAGQTLRATMSLIVAQIGNWRIVRPVATFTLAPYEQKDITFLVLQRHNAQGSGAPAPAAVGQNITFTCLTASAR